MFDNCSYFSEEWCELYPRLGAHRNVPNRFGKRAIEKRRQNHGKTKREYRARLMLDMGLLFVSRHFWKAMYKTTECLIKSYSIWKIRTVIGAKMSHRKWRETKQQLIWWPGSAWLQLSFSPNPVRHPGADHGISGGTSWSKVILKVNETHQRTLVLGPS